MDIDDIPVGIPLMMNCHIFFHHLPNKPVKCWLEVNPNAPFNRIIILDDPNLGGHNCTMSGKDAFVDYVRSKYGNITGRCIWANGPISGIEVYFPDGKAREETPEISNSLSLEGRIDIL